MLEDPFMVCEGPDAALAYLGRVSGRLAGEVGQTK